MNHYQVLKKNTALLFVGSIGSKLISFLLIRFYTSVLSPSEYGIIDIIFTLSNLIIPIVTFSTEEGVVRFLLDVKVERKGILFSGMFILVLGSFFSVFLIPLVNIYVPNVYLIYFLIYVILNGVHNLFGAFLKGTDLIKVYSYGSIILTFCISIINIFMLKIIHWGIKGYLLSYCIAYCVCNIYFFHYIGLNEFAGCSIRKQFKTIKELIKYSAPLVANNISWWINNTIDRLFIVSLIGNEVNGIYSAANKIPTLISILSMVFINAWQISTASVINYNADKALFFRNVSNKFSKIMILTCGFVIVLCKPISAILFADSFFVAWRYVPMLLVGSFFCNYSGFLGGILTAHRRTNVVFYSTFAGAIANCILNSILIGRYNAMGAAIATCMGYAINFAIRILYIDMNHKYGLFGRKQIIAIFFLIVEGSLITSWYYLGIILFVFICFEVRDEVIKDCKMVIQMVRGRSSGNRTR